MRTDLDAWGASDFFLRCPSGIPTQVIAATNTPKGRESR